jgi:hypothetical protein
MFSGTAARSTQTVCRCAAIIALALMMLGWFARSASAHQRPALSALAQSHPYRHGVVPMRGHLKAALAQSANSGNLVYNGGAGGIGVVTGPPRVYLVFWGSQWGSQGTDSQGDVTLSGDSLAVAPDLQQFMKGLGTGGETWSGVMTQYCQGVPTGAQSCPSGVPHIAYPTGGVLAGVWVDNSSFDLPLTTGHQIGLEAVAAANHFGNTSPSANSSAQYVIISPPGTHPDGFNMIGSQFCAWHDSTADSTLSGGAVSSPYGPLAFTNLPYVADAGAKCGQGFVNSGSAGTLDGVTIVEGHEYAETLTDPFPPTGWVDSSGAETGDKCAWIKSGQGASQNITLSTGTFPVQSTWANDYNGASGGCEIGHPTVGS